MFAPFGRAPQAIFSSDPIVNPCYCDRCKKALTASRILDESHAWCPQCRDVVGTSLFYVPSWTIGVLLLLVTVTVQ